MDTQHTLRARAALPVILIAAVIHGWALYGLHLSITGKHWPATDPAWLLALYAVAIGVPLTVQMLAEYARQSLTWLIVGGIAIAFFYFGWHQGAAVVGDANTVETSAPVLLGITLIVLWLMLLPFAQCRLRGERWLPRYDHLFAVTWRNKLTLAEAALFTGLFWLLLFLWQALFGLLGIKFFQELFSEPIFVYPVTALTFGLALHLIGSVERFTAAVLEQLLNVLKWLAVVAGLILALFTVALLFKLPNLVFSGEKAISAGWLLWLVAVIVLLVNAAYRDGSIEVPYPRWVALALRLIIPLTVVVAITAVYSVIVRIDAYGLTVQRTWALIVASAALAYSVGYGIAAPGRGRWMNGIARVNVWVALALIATIILTLTPALSPYRLAANSQFHLALAKAIDTDQAWQRGTHSPLSYLRFEAGEYGLAKLRALAAMSGRPQAAAARAMLDRKQRWESPPVPDADALLAKLAIYPAGRTVPPPLAMAMRSEESTPALMQLSSQRTDQRAGLFIDLNDDGTEEFILLAPFSAFAYEQQNDGWRPAGAMSTNRPTIGNDALMRSLGNAEVSTHTPRFKELKVGAQLYRFNEPHVAKR
jgi:hypothetical protein